MNDEKKQARKEERAKKRTQRAVAKKIHQLKKEDRKNRFSRNNTNPTPEGVSPKRQARRLNKASNPSEGVKKMGDGYGKSRKTSVASGPTTRKTSVASGPTNRKPGVSSGPLDPGILKELGLSSGPTNRKTSVGSGPTTRKPGVGSGPTNPKRQKQIGKLSEAQLKALRENKKKS